MILGSKYAWALPAPRTDELYAHAASCNLSFPVAHILASRGYTAPAAMTEFLFPESACSDATLLHDAERAATRIEQAIASGEKMLISGDYDVDGVTSSAVMMSCLLPLGANVNFFLPNRQRDGYGLSVATIERAAANGYRVVITVDNGIAAIAPARRARELGIDLIITDHHRPQAELPDAYAIVNPHHPACRYPFKGFAGVGVSYKLMSLIYARRKLPMPPKVDELVTLGTIADVVPLLGENRALVQRGLRAINAQESMPIGHLKENARLNKPALRSLDIGFYLAPQINALGRLDDARAAVGFLLGLSEADSRSVARTLAEMNSARKDVEQRVFKEVVAQIESGAISLSEHGVIVVGGNDWPPGVVGLVASRLVGMYGRPAIILHITKDGIAKGSCRSIPEINIFEALESVADLCISFGGHPMAAGASFKYEHLAQFRSRLNAYIRERVSIDELKQKLYLDAEIDLPDVNHKLVADLELLEPFGAGNREPVFLIRDATWLQEPTLLKGAHCKATLFSNGVIKPIVFFNRIDIYEQIRAHPDRPCYIAASVSENHWNGRVSIELIGLDVAWL